MCQVTDQLKFCTCTKGGHKNLPNYWLLYQYNKKKELFCIGEPVIRWNELNPHHHLNEAKILARINEVDAFDKKIAFKDKDQLEVVLNNLSTDQMVFFFEYQQGQWKKADHDMFELMNHYDKWRHGGFESL